LTHDVLISPGADAAVARARMSTFVVLVSACLECIAVHELVSNTFIDIAPERTLGELTISIF
jgi:hypothetical protein